MASLFPQLNCLFIWESLDAILRVEKETLKVIIYDVRFPPHNTQRILQSVYHLHGETLVCEQIQYRSFQFPLYRRLLMVLTLEVEPVPFSAGYSMRSHGGPWEQTQLFDIYIAESQWSYVFIENF